MTWSSSSSWPSDSSAARSLPFMLFTLALITSVMSLPIPSSILPPSSTTLPSSSSAVSPSSSTVSIASSTVSVASATVSPSLSILSSSSSTFPPSSSPLLSSSLALPPSPSSSVVPSVDSANATVLFSDPTNTYSAGWEQEADDAQTSDLGASCSVSLPANATSASIWGFLQPHGSQLGVTCNNCSLSGTFTQFDGHNPSNQSSTNLTFLGAVHGLDPTVMTNLTLLNLPDPRFDGENSTIAWQVIQVETLDAQTSGPVSISNPSPTDPNQPATSTDQLATSTDQLATSTDQPATSTNQPATSTDQPTGASPTTSTAETDPNAPGFTSAAGTTSEANPGGGSQQTSTDQTPGTEPSPTSTATDTTPDPTPVITFTLPGGTTSGSSQPTTVAPSSGPLSSPSSSAAGATTSHQSGSGSKKPSKTSSSGSSPSSGSDNLPTNKSRLSSGVLAVVVLGALFGFVIFIVLPVLFYLKRHRGQTFARPRPGARPQSGGSGYNVPDNTALLAAVRAASDEAIAPNVIPGGSSPVMRQTSPDGNLAKRLMMSKKPSSAQVKAAQRESFQSRDGTLANLAELAMPGSRESSQGSAPSLSRPSHYSQQSVYSQGSALHHSVGETSPDSLATSNFSLREFPEPPPVPVPPLPFNNYMPRADSPRGPRQPRAA